MDTTVTYSSSAINPLSVLAGVRSGANHVVVSSHGGFPSQHDKANAAKLSMFISGFKLKNVRIDLGNVEGVFAVLKGKVDPQCVVWLGGCNIGANHSFCKAAAKASGCHVVATEMDLIVHPFPKEHVDMLDGYARPKIFKPDGSDPSSPNDFCAMQEKYKFSVPI